MPQPVVSSRYLFFFSPPKMVFTFKPACRATSTNATPKGASCLPSTCLCVGEDWPNSVEGQIGASTCSKDKTIPVRLSDCKNLRRVWSMADSNFVLGFSSFAHPRSLRLVMRKGLVFRGPLVCVLLLALVSISGTVFAQESAAQSDENLELKRPVRSWEFVDATGSKAALLGNEAGHLEAWVYPLKLFRNFTLRFHGKDQVLAAEEMARELIVRPESTTIVYASGSWAVHETLLVPPEEPGAMIRLDIDTFVPLQVEAQF